MNMNQSDEDVIELPTTFSGEEYVRGDIWNSSSSSSTLVGDELVVSSRSSPHSSNSPFRIHEIDDSLSSNLDNANTNLVALRPLYSGAYHSPTEDAAPRLPEMKLSQRSRKGHRKSRQGCFNCKRRKIKCQETLPSCDNCIRKELVCKYPLVKGNALLQAGSGAVGSPLTTVQLQTTPIFSLADMRLFHHFIFHAYPHLPVGNDQVWVRRIPAVAYHYDYLMHAILALAASHLTITGEADYAALALSHRILAIKGFNESLSKTPRTGSDGDALLAACYALTFQSSYMNDGIGEFLTLVRGCGLVSFQLLVDGVDLSFTISPTRHMEYMEARLDNLPTIEADLYDGALASFEALLPMCENDVGHKEFYGVLRDCVCALGSDSRRGYFAFILIYQVLGKMTNQQFQNFSNPANLVSQLLLAHFVAVEIMIAPVIGREWKGRFMSTPMEGILSWLNKIRRDMSPSLLPFLSWPTSVVRIIESEIFGEKPPRPWLKTFFRRREAHEILDCGPEVIYDKASG